MSVATIPADSSCVCTALRKAVRAVSRSYDEAMIGTGMTIAQFSVLRHIARGGAIPLSRLAEALVMDRTSLYRALAPLEQKGLVTTRSGPKGRARIAALTESGRGAMETATIPWRAAQKRLIGAMGEEAWATLEAALGGVMRIADRA